MDKYLGVKIVEATKMDELDFVAEKAGGLDKLGSGLMANRKGYKVVYPNGYASWSPKEEFENAYLALGPDSSRITPPVIDSILASIITTQIDPKTCLVKGELITGFTDYSTSACVDPKNYDEAIGTAIAMKDIKDRMWFAMGFLLQWAQRGLKAVPRSYNVTGPVVPLGAQVGSYDPNAAHSSS